VGLPEFLLRKLYAKGSLAETAPGWFRFMLRNPLGTATLIMPPQVAVNGIAYPPEKVKAKGVDLAAIGPKRPFTFHKGDEVLLKLPGSLLRAANHIDIVAQTKEFGELHISVEDKCAEFCDLPGADGTDRPD
jgi:hypothetical protein